MIFVSAAGVALLFTYQSLNNGAVWLIASSTLVRYCPQRALQLFQISDFFGNRVKVILSDPVNLSTCVAAAVYQRKKTADLGNRKAELAGAENKPQSLLILGRVEPVPTLRTCGRQHQANAFIIANCFQIAGGTASKFTPFYVISRNRERHTENSS